MTTTPAAGPVAELTQITTKHLHASVFYWESAPYQTFPWEGPGYYLMAPSPEFLGASQADAVKAVEDRVGAIRTARRGRFWERLEEAVTVGGRLYRAWNAAPADDADDDEFKLPD